MIRNAKRKGSRAEHRTMALLESAGYRCMRSGGSLGEWDIIAIGTVDTVLVQVKCNRRPGTLEMLALRDFKTPPNYRKLVHVWPDHARKPQVVEL
jgi:Holliday junction resolvase-like predicted endonuclease